MAEPTNDNHPSLLKWGLSIAASAGLTGMLCCVAPMVLFMFGIMGGAYAISFADFFYQTDGSAGVGAWVLRILAVMIGLGGAWRYKTQQEQCSVDPKRHQQRQIQESRCKINIFGKVLSNSKSRSTKNQYPTYHKTLMSQ